MPAIDAKIAVRDHWESETCGTRDATAASGHDRLSQIRAARYRYVPEIPAFANFAQARGKKVLEIGVGAGTDFSQWVAAGADAYGIDLTDAAIHLTRLQLSSLNLTIPFDYLSVGDAEELTFPSGNFDIVYSWGVLHHSPQTEQAFREATRVLKPGGQLLAMVYHARSWTALFYWIRFALLKGRPFVSPRTIIATHMESRYTKVYSIDEMRDLLNRCGLDNIEITPRLMQGDLFNFKLSDRYDNVLNRLVRRFMPRWLIRACGHRFGGMLMIRATRR